MWMNQKNRRLSEKKKKTQPEIRYLTYDKLYLHFKNKQTNSIFYGWINREQNYKNIYGNETSQFGYLQ